MATDYDLSDASGLIRSWLRHVGFVRVALNRVSTALRERATVHDLSKLLDDEFAGFARINAAARVHKFGSDEYREGMKRERPTIDLHFSRNRHHPEYYGKRIAGGRLMSDEMGFLDVIEMVCDWWGASNGYDDPRPWSESVKLNIDAKGKYLTREQLWLAHQVADFLGGAEHGD